MATKTYRILLVDDEPRNLRLLEGILAADGYDLRQASDGLAALDEAAANPPDFVLLDVTMPRANGIDVCRRLKSSGAFVPVVLVTSLSDRESRLAGLEAGADAHTQSAACTAATVQEGA